LFAIYSMKDRPKILLTGASGSVGCEVLKQLYQQRDKYDITVLGTRSKRSLKNLAPYKKGITIVYGDITNNDDVRKVCTDVDFVIHLAAVIPPLADEKPELASKVNATGTENLIRNLEQLSPDVFFIYSSSISVYGDRIEAPLIKAGDPLIPSDRDEYAKTKIKAENIICSSKLDWSIFRLTAIMGDHKISKLMFHMPLSTPVEIATPEDTARSFVIALENRSGISKKIFNLGGGVNCRTTYEELLTNMFGIFGLGRLNFPDKTFAEKNFHCGFYEDGDNLEAILHFRNDTLESFYRKEKLKIPFLRKAVTYVFKNPVKSYLLKKSEPYQAFKNNNQTECRHYFKTK
jgi:nucleoside-diphosphate-sugar epimerase